jgi:hypothetical protein
VAERAVFPRQKEEGRRTKEEFKTAVAERAVFPAAVQTLRLGGLESDSWQAYTSTPLEVAVP